MHQFITLRPFLLSLLGLLIVFFLLLSAFSVQAQGNINPSLEFSVSVAGPEIIPGEEADLIIEVVNTGDNSVESYTFLLYLTEGLTLAQDKKPHDPYEPLLTETVSLAPGASEKVIVPLYLFENVKARQGVALVHQREADGRPGEMVARLEVLISGDPMSREAQADYNMPTPPNVSCGTPPPLSSIGNVVNQTIAGAYFSQHTACNKFEGDWILDVPNVVTTTTSTTAESFYTAIADLLRDTRYTFSMSTLGFDTHDETNDEHALVRHYLAPAIKDLHEYFRAHPQPDGVVPLLRFAYADSDEILGLSPDYDDLDEVYADLISELPDPNIEPWRVSIAVATIGKIHVANPWNHSKIVVQDYRQAIVGGMNWELNYIVSVDVDGNGEPDDDVQRRLHDLSVNVEGAAARGAGIFFDLLWRRNIDPLFPGLNNDCKVSWDIPPLWISDCQLEHVLTYAPDNHIPDYSVSNHYNVFSLGRGHTEWGGVGFLDDSADKAVLTAFDAAKDSIYISQHQLTNPLFAEVRDGFTPEVKEALLDAIVDHQVPVKIIISDPWGYPDAHALLDVFTVLDDELFERAQDKYSDPVDIFNALCRLEFGPFRRDPNLPNDYTHNKFFMVDEKVFYVGSQNLYPSAIGDTSILIFPIPELNEYGFLIDDPTLTALIKQEYWDPVWNLVKAENRLFRSRYLPSDWVCIESAIYLPFLAK